MLRLIAKDIKDKELLFKLIHEKGTLVYRHVKETNEYEILYFSGEKVGYFKGQLSEDELKTKIFPNGFKVEEIVFDEITGDIQIRQ